MLSLIEYVTLELSRPWLLLNSFIFLKCILTSFLSCFHTLLVNVFLNVNSIGQMIWLLQHLTPLEGAVVPLEPGERYGGI